MSKRFYMLAVTPFENISAYMRTWTLHSFRGNFFKTD